MSFTPLRFSLRVRGLLRSTRRPRRFETAAKGSTSLALPLAEMLGSPTPKKCKPTTTCIGLEEQTTAEDSGNLVLARQG